MDKDGNEMGNSKTAAQSGIAAVMVSRIAMAAPAMGKRFSFFLQCFLKNGYLKYPLGCNQGTY